MVRASLLTGVGPCSTHLQDKSPDREQKRRHRSSEPAEGAASEPAEPAAEQAAVEERRADKEERRAEKEQRRAERASAERERRLGPRLFDRAMAAAVRDSGKRSGEEEEARHRSSKRSRK